MPLSNYLNVTLDYIYDSFVFALLRISCDDEGALLECQETERGSSFLMIDNRLKYCTFYGFDLRYFNRTMIYGGRNKTY